MVEKLGLLEVPLVNEMGTAEPRDTEGIDGSMLAGGGTFDEVLIQQDDDRRQVTIKETQIARRAGRGGGDWC
jgi:hypothetical protein